MVELDFLCCCCFACLVLVWLFETGFSSVALVVLFFCFPSSFMWVPDMELRFLGLVASTFTHVLSFIQYKHIFFYFLKDSFIADSKLLYVKPDILVMSGITSLAFLV